MPMHGFPINWNAPVGSALLKHPLYISYASTPIQELDKSSIQASLGASLADRASAEVINYLVWLLRTIELQTAP